MKALISPNQNNVVAEVSADDKIFEVAEPLFWVDCPDDCIAYQYEYVNNQVILIPVPEYVAPPEPTKAELMAELAALTAKIQALGA